MRRTTLSIASIALQLATAPIAAADAVCTNRVAACPLSSDDAGVRIIDSTIAFNPDAQRWEETVCFVLTNASELPQVVEAKLQITDQKDAAPVCFDSVHVQPLAGGQAVSCLAVPGDCAGGGVAATLAIRPTAPELRADGYTDLCCAVYAAPALCTDLPEAGDTLDVAFAGGTTNFTVLVEPIPSGSCAGEPEVSSVSNGGPFGIELLLVAPVWLRRRRWRRRASAVSSALLLGGLVGVVRPARAVDVVLEVDPLASSIQSRLDLGDTIDRSVVPAGAFDVTITLATLPDLHVTSLRVNPGSAVEASVVWAPPAESQGAFEVDVAFLEDAAVSAGSDVLPATRVGPNTSTFEVGGQVEDPMSGVVLEVDAGRFELHGATPEGAADAVRDFAVAPSRLRNATVDPGQIEIEPNGSGGVDVTLTIPVEICDQVDDDSSFFWLHLDGALVLRGTLPACGDTIDNDGDGLVDFGLSAPMQRPADPGCAKPESKRENPECQDGINNDPEQDRRIDFDGGRSAGVPSAQQTLPDPQCIGRPAKDSESRRLCGGGVELLLLLLLWLKGGSGAGLAGLATLAVGRRPRP